jgi:hypothetical protein
MQYIHSHAATATATLPATFATLPPTPHCNTKPPLSPSILPQITPFKKPQPSPATATATAIHPLPHCHCHPSHSHYQIATATTNCHCHTATQRHFRISPSILPQITPFQALPSSPATSTAIHPLPRCHCHCHPSHSHYQIATATTKLPLPPTRPTPQRCTPPAPPVAGSARGPCQSATHGAGVAVVWHWGWQWQKWQWQGGSGKSGSGSCKNGSGNNESGRGRRMGDW